MQFNSFNNYMDGLQPFIVVSGYTCACVRFLVLWDVELIYRCRGNFPHLQKFKMASCHFLKVTFI